MNTPLPETPAAATGSAAGADPDGRPRRSADRDAPNTGANVRHAGAVMLIAFALMAAFNSSGLRGFARDVPEGWLADELVVRSDQWHALMLELGPARVRPAASDMFERLRAIRW